MNEGPGNARTHKQARTKLRKRLRKAGLDERQIQLEVQALWKAQLRARALGLPVATAKTTRSREVLLDLDGCCAYCGSTEKPTIDHIIPRKLGGSNALANRVRACQPCNTRKGHKLLRQLGWRIAPAIVARRKGTLYEIAEHPNGHWPVAQADPGSS